MLHKLPKQLYQTVSHTMLRTFARPNNRFFSNLSVKQLEEDIKRHFENGLYESNLFNKNHELSQTNPLIKKLIDETQNPQTASAARTACSNMANFMIKNGLHQPIDDACSIHSFNAKQLLLAGAKNNNKALYDAAYKDAKNGNYQEAIFLYTELLNEEKTYDKNEVVACLRLASQFLMKMHKESKSYTTSDAVEDIKSLFETASKHTQSPELRNKLKSAMSTTENSSLNKHQINNTTFSAKHDSKYQATYIRLIESYETLENDILGTHPHEPDPTIFCENEPFPPFPPLALRK